LAETTSQIDLLKLSEEEIIKLFEQKTIEFATIPEPQRSEYAKQLILNLIESAKQILSLPKIQQAPIFAQFYGELLQNTPTILPPILFTMKRGTFTINCPHCNKPVEIHEPDFRQFYNDLIMRAYQDALEQLKK